MVIEAARSTDMTQVGSSLYQSSQYHWIKVHYGGSDTQEGEFSRRTREQSSKFHTDHGVYYFLVLLMGMPPASGECYTILARQYNLWHIPLRELTWNNVQFKWTNACKENFKELKNCLSDKTVLRPVPDIWECGAEISKLWKSFSEKCLHSRFFLQNWP